MSDHDEAASNRGYNTPVPELDDHRHQSISQQRSERPRRGTVDTLYGSRQHLDHQAVQSPIEIKVRDFEEAVVDDDEAGLSPGALAIAAQLLIRALSAICPHPIR